MENSAPLVCGYRVQTRPPAFFSLIKGLTRLNVRGSSRILSMVSRGEVVEYRLDSQHKLTVPIFREDNRWDREDIVTYETILLGEMGQRAREFRNATLIDCGADIGLFSVRLCQEVSPTIQHVIAIEPNAEVLPFLKKNLTDLSVGAVMIGGAVANIGGTGRLEVSHSDRSDHARYLVMDRRGDILVTTIDSLNVCGDVIIKIDVEGGEYAVLEGAAETIRHANRCLVCLEAHSEVAKRTGRDPVQFLRFLNTLRPFTFILATGEGLQPLSLDKDMFDPSSRQKTIWNVIAEAAPRGDA